MKILEEFITKFSDKTYILSKENSYQYHKVHGIFLYFLYLVFIMYQNIEKNTITKENIKNTKLEGIYE
jgi:hypothetical protein